MEQIDVVLTESALADLVDIEDYISQDSPSIARKFISQIFDKIDILSTFPELGKIVPELKDRTIREILIKKYRVIYKFAENENTINIVRIVHGSRLLDIEF